MSGRYQFKSLHEPIVLQQSSLYISIHHNALKSIYIYMVPPPKKKLCSHHFCWYLQYVVYFGLPFDPCFFLGGTIYIYIYICVHVGYMTCLSTLEGMQSECVQCIQNAFLPNTKTKIQDLHRSLVENLGNTKIQDPRFPQDSWLKS